MTEDAKILVSVAYARAKISAAIVAVQDAMREEYEDKAGSALFCAEAYLEMADKSLSEIERSKVYD